MKVQGSLLFVLLAGLSALAEQAPHIPARLEVEAPRNVVRGQAGKVNIKLLDAKGQPFTATKDLKFNVKTSSGQLDQQTIIIHKGSNSADVTVSKNAPGISNIQVDGVDNSAAGLAGGTQVGFTPNTGYTPVPPLSLLITVQPATKLKAGVDTAKVIVRYVDKSNVPVPAKTAIKVDFPGVGNMLTPASVTIAAGGLYGEADLASTLPQTVPLNAIASPPIAVNNATAEFVSPIAATRVIPDHNYVKSVRHRKITLAIGLIDDQGNWIASDKDRTLLLQVDPPSAGTFSVSSVTIPKGQSTVTATFTPLEEGQSMIKAVAGDIASPDASFEFYYAALYFWLIAAVGGLIGGGVRNALGDDHSVKKIVVHVAGGLVIGVLTYLIAPLLVGLSLKPAGLENGSKLFEAFAWGFVGGGSGITLLGRIFMKNDNASKPAPPSNEPPKTQVAKP
jgi:hypothetical protein